MRHPARETSYIERNEDGTVLAFVCGVPVEPGSAPVAMRDQIHPGFGYVALIRNGKVVDYDVHGRRGGHQLRWYEQRAAINPRARWEIEVGGALGGYTLRRIRGQWYVTKTNEGFA